MKTQQQKDAHAAYMRDYFRRHPERRRAAKKRWRHAHPEYRIAKRKEMADYRARNQEKRKKDLRRWKLANRERLRNYERNHRIRQRAGRVGVFNCATKGCARRVPHSGMFCNACCLPLPAITMHDRAIGITDWYRSDGSLPPMHILKSRAKKYFPPPLARGGKRISPSRPA